MVELEPDAGICLVDHQQRSQVNSAIPAERIVGVIDHHALQAETIVTAMPIYLDVRPWYNDSQMYGPSCRLLFHELLTMAAPRYAALLCFTGLRGSMSTIIAHNYFTMGKR